MGAMEEGKVTAADDFLRDEDASLLDTAHGLLKLLADAEHSLEYGTSQFYPHTEWAHRVAWLHGHLTAACRLLEQHNYAPALALIRVGLEHHLLDRLLFLGDRYAEIREKPAGQSAGEYEAELERLRTAAPPRLAKWSRVRKKSGRYRVVWLSPRFTDAPDQWLSVYRFVIEEYEPTAGKPRRAGGLRRNFNSLADLREAAERARGYWRTYLKIGRVLENLRLNELINEHEELQLDLHYSFLSGYVHPTGFGYEQLRGNLKFRPAPEYDHFVSELTLLYIIRIATEELRAFHEGIWAQRAGTTIPAQTAIEKALEAADRTTAHFWFIGHSRPHEWDRVRSVDDVMYLAAGGDDEVDTAKLFAMKTIDPASLGPDEITYEPNPLERLIRLHGDGGEFMTGTRYRSPFPRRDSRNRR